MTEEVKELWARALKARETGDYGVMSHISVEDARDCLSKADGILEAVKSSCPDLSGCGGVASE